MCLWKSLIRANGETLFQVDDDHLASKQFPMVLYTTQQDSGDCSEALY